MRLGLAVKTMKHLMYMMPLTHSEILIFFQSFENMAMLNQIDLDLYVPTLNAFLNDKAKKILATLTIEQISDYKTFKEAILKEFHITSRNCQKSFNQAVKRPDESYTQFSSRLANLFANYLSSRKVGQDYQKLVDLCLAVRFKQSLTISQKYRISDLEIEDWFPITRLASLIDHYVSERGDNENANATKVATTSGRPTNEVKKTYYCAKCGRDSNHSTNFCRKRITPITNDNDKSQEKWKGGNVTKGNARIINNKLNSNRRVNAVSVVEGEDFLQDEEDELEEEVEDEDQEIKQVNRVELRVDSVERCHDIALLEKLKSIKSENEENMVSVNFGNDFVLCKIDSGADLTILTSQMINKDCLADGSSVTKVNLMPAFGNLETAILCNVEARLLKNKDDKNNCGRDLESGIILTCAISDKLNSSYGLLSLADYKSLCEHNQILIPNTCIVSNTNLLCTEIDSINGSQLAENKILNSVDVLAVEDGEKMNLEEVPINFEVEKNAGFKDMQLEDVSLNRCWKSLELKDTKFFIDENTQLFYRSKTMGVLKINHL